MALIRLLEDSYPKVTANLKEGLMLHRLGVHELLRDRLRTTDIIESISG